MKVTYQGATANGFQQRIAIVECENEIKEARERLKKTSFRDCVVYADNYCIEVEVSDKEEFNNFMYEWKKTRPTPKEIEQ